MQTLATMFLGATLIASTPIAPPETYIRPLELYTVPELIEHYAILNDQDPKLLLKVADCESKYEKDLVGDSGHAFSVFQFHRPTFERWSKEYGEELNYESYHDHIELAAWAFAQGENYRKAWTTYVAIKKGGTYSFYSKLLKKDFVVKMIQDFPDESQQNTLLTGWNKND